MTRTRCHSVRLAVCVFALAATLGTLAQVPETREGFDRPTPIQPDRALPDTGSKPAPQPVGSAPTASVLQLIKFSGSVTDAQGVAGVTFALYADPEGGSPLWLETQNVWLDAEGRYTVLLGATSSEGLPLDIFSSGNARWLGIQPQGQPEQQRILLVAVPYALKAAEADRLAGRAASDYLLAEQLESQVKQTVETQVADQLETKSLSGGGDNTLAQVTGTGTSGKLAKFTSTGVDPTVGDSIIIENGGKIGINTNSPGVILEVNSGGADISPAMSFTTPNEQDFISIFGGRLNNQNPFISWRRGPLRFATADSLLGANFIERMRITPTGKVGINTTNPQVVLEVNSGGADLSPAMAFTTPNEQDFVSIFGGRLNNQNPFIAWRRGPLRFATADSLLGLNFSEKMRLTPTGNLGIGTTNPQGKLHVVGQSGGLLIQDTATSPNIIGGFSGNTVTGGVVGATIAGGGASTFTNRVTDDFATVGGGRNNQAGNGTGNFGDAESATVGGGLFNTASGQASTIGGGNFNLASGVNSTVAGGGGGIVAFRNTASGGNSFVGGGMGNTASGGNSTVSGGSNNRTINLATTVAGGNNNRAASSGATVGGGANNIAGCDGTEVSGPCVGFSMGPGGFQQTVPGGISNAAIGHVSFAAGQNAQALHGGAFVWGDNSSGTISSTANNQFIARAAGGFFFQSDSTLDSQGGFLNTSTGGFLSNGGTWTDASDVALKENFAPVDPDHVLARLARMPVQHWNYRAEGPGVNRLGPTAQDFFAAFGLGTDDKHISGVDAHGVAFAAIQALYRVGQQRDQRLRDLEAENARLRQELADRLGSLEAELAALKAQLNNAGVERASLSD